MGGLKKAPFFLRILTGTGFASLTRRAGLIPPLLRMTNKSLPFGACRLGIPAQRIYLLHFCHYLQTLAASKTLCISVTPFSLARLSSLRKEGKTASWIIASRLQAVRFILFSQNIRSLFRRFFEFRALPSLYAKSAISLYKNVQKYFQGFHR